MTHGQTVVLSQLRARFERPHARGSVCVLSGSPGVGKTFVAERFLREIPSDLPKLKGRGLPSGVAPLLPICEAIRSHRHGESLEQLRTVAKEYVTDQGGRLFRRPDAAVLSVVSNAWMEPCAEMPLCVAAKWRSMDAAGR